MSEISNSVPLEEETLQPVRLSSRIGVRLVWIVLLSLTLIEAARWGMDVTNANARQISSNVLRMEGRVAPFEGTSKRSQPVLVTEGPVLEPVRAKKGRK